MAIQFEEQKKKQRYLLWILLVALLIIAVVIWYGFFIKSEQDSLIVVVPPREIKIDFRILENPFLQESQLFEEISPFEKETGRNNPFLPY